MTLRHPRRRLFIDRRLQLAVLGRALMYWAVCLLGQLLMVFFFSFVMSSQDDFVANGPQLWWHLQLSVTASVVLLPIIMLDLLKLTHRWAGPIFRLRTSLKSLAQGEEVSLVQFRGRDFWPELAGEFNLVAEELNRLRAASPTESVNKASPADFVASVGPDVKPTSSAI